MVTPLKALIMNGKETGAPMRRALRFLKS